MFSNIKRPEAIRYANDISEPWVFYYFLLEPWVFYYFLLEPWVFYYFLFKYLFKHLCNALRHIEEAEVGGVHAVNGEVV